MTKQILIGVLVFLALTIPSFPSLVFPEPIEEFSENGEQMEPEIARFFEKFDEALTPEIKKLNKPPSGEVSIPYFFALQGPIFVKDVPVRVAIGIGIAYRIARHPVQRILRYHMAWRAPLSRIREESLVAEAVAWYTQFANKLIAWRWGTPLDGLDPNLIMCIEHIERHFLVPEQRLGVRGEDDERPTLIIDYYETFDNVKRIKVFGALEFAPTGIIDRLQGKGERFLAQGILTPTTDYNRVGAMVAKAAFRMLIELYHHRKPSPFPFLKKII